MAALAALTACSGGADEPTTSASASATTAATASANADGSVTIEHAFGTTTIEGTPDNVATVQWANHEVP
ncbi:MAG: iron-siderophore ABC transporter substrate-binding protein, partial [Demequina sp.]